MLTKPPPRRGGSGAVSILPPAVKRRDARGRGEGHPGATNHAGGAGYREAMGTWRFSGDNVRHAATMLWQGSNPAASVYDSLGPDFFLALEPGWLNLGLWE